MTQEPTIPPTPPAPLAPPAPTVPAALPPTAPETVTINATEFRQMQGRLGTMMEKERQREAEKAAIDQQEAIKRGEHEKVITGLQKDVDVYKAQASMLQDTLTEQWQELSATVPKDDERFKDVFVVPADGKKLSIDDLRGNITQYRKLNKLGVFTPAGSPPAPREITPHPKPPAGGAPDFARMSDAEFRQYRLSHGLA